MARRLQLSRRAVARRLLPRRVVESGRVRRMLRMMASVAIVRMMRRLVLRRR